MILLLILLSSHALAISGKVHDSDDALTKVRQGLYDLFLSNEGEGCTSACASAASYASTLLLTNFTWTDINYTDRSPAAWKTSEHLVRTEVLARSFRCSSCGPHLFANRTIESMTLGALDLWLDRDFQNPNWWYNCFSSPGQVGQIVILLGRDALTPADLQRVLAMLLRANGSYTGDNIVTSGGVLITRAVLAEDLGLLTAAFTYLWSCLFLSSRGEDGIQPDGMFFQHGPLVQTGSYGAELATDLLVYANIASNTSVAVGGSQLDALARLVLVGDKYSQRWNGLSAPAVVTWDVSVKGRAISRPPNGELGVDTRQLIPALRDISGKHKADFAALADRYSGNGTRLVGSQHFWCSDYTAHHRDAFFISLHMKSVHTLPSECMNLENMRGWHLGDGATMLYQDGGEYAGLFPVWSWTRIPGTTARQGVDEKLCQVGIQGSTTFVGGVCSAGLCVSAMLFSAADWGGVGEKDAHLAARKSWFFLDQGLLALGSGVTLAYSAPVTTTLDQTSLRGDVYAGVVGKSPQVLPEGEHTLQSMDYVTHANMTYVLNIPSSFTGNDTAFPSAPYFLRNVLANGSWYLINECYSPSPVSRKTLTIEADHGTAPFNSTYAYAVLPGVPVEQADKKVSDLWTNAKVLSSTEGLVHSVLYQRQSSEQTSQHGQNSQDQKNNFHHPHHPHQSHRPHHMEQELEALNANQTEVLFVAAFAEGSVTGGGAGWAVDVPAQSFWILSWDQQAGNMTITAASPIADASLTLTIDRPLSGGSQNVRCMPNGMHATVTVTLPVGADMVGSAVSGVCVSV